MTIAGGETACPRVGKWVRGCRFEPRFSEGAPRPLTEDELAELWPSDVPKALKRMRPITYVCDVCVTCGRTTVPQSNEAA